MTLSMKFALAFIYGFVALESDIGQPGVQPRSKCYVASVPIPGFECVPGSSEFMLLSSSISNDNLEASVSIFFPSGMKVYSPGDIINVCAKFVALPNQKMFLDTTIHQMSVIGVSFPYRDIC